MGEQIFCLAACNKAKYPYNTAHDNASMHVILKELAVTNKARDRCKSTALGGLANTVDTTMIIIHDLVDYSSNKDITSKEFGATYDRNLLNEWEAQQ